MKAKAQNEKKPLIAVVLQRWVRPKFTLDYSVDGWPISMNGKALSKQQILELLTELDRKIAEAYEIAFNSPELNMRNYTEEEVTDLNNAMCDVCCILESEA